jgi:hypothetical protein
MEVVVNRTVLFQVGLHCLVPRSPLNQQREYGKPGLESMENLGSEQVQVLYLLVEHDQCWTAGKLAKRGLDHPEHCPLCD